MSATLDSMFQNPHAPLQSEEDGKVRVVADENKAGQSRVYFGKGENDYLNVRGDAAETALLADVIGKLAESERTVAKFADVPPEDRPFIICADAGKDWGGYYQSNVNLIVLDAKKARGYDLAGILAHELHHFEQHRRMEWMNLPVNTAEQIFVERIGEATADVAKYQYLYDVKDSPDAREAVENVCNPWARGGRQYFNAKAAGKSEGECVLAAMGGYASSVSTAESYAKNYHRDLFEVQQGKIDYWVKECDPAKMEKYEKIWAEKCVSDIARAGDKVDEVAYFKQLTTGMMSEPPADEKIARALRDPEFDYVPQNAYDRLKLLEPAVEKFFPNERFLQGVNVNVNEFGRQGVCPREEYDLYKAERDRQGAREAAARQREKTAREQLDLMREEARRENPEWTDLHGYLHNLSADVDRETAVEKSGAESAFKDVDPDCLAAGDDGTALRLLYQKENAAFRARVSGLYGEFKQNEAAARDDVKNKSEIARDKNDAFRKLESVEQTAGLMRGVVDDLVASYPASMRGEARAALLKGVDADEKVEMPKAKTFKDKVALLFNKRKIVRNQAVVDNTFKQIRDKAAIAAAIDPAGFDKRLSAARQEADKAFADRADAERNSDRLKRALNAECEKLRGAMSENFEIKAGKMLIARQARDNAAEKANDPKSRVQPSLQSRLSTDKTGLMQKLRNQTARRPDVSKSIGKQPARNAGESR